MAHPTTNPAPDGARVAPLAFHGGLAGALAPFLLFLAGVAALALQGAPDEKGFWPVLLAALTLGLLLVRDRTRYAEAMLDGMSQRMVMVMVCAWLLAGVLGAVLGAAGFVDALAWAARRLALSGGAYVAAAYLACVVVSMATGTSFGTILLCGPLLYPAGGAAGAQPAVLMGAILAGATVGDSLSPVSDTTIASAGTQGMDIGGTVRARLPYAATAGVLALVAGWALGGGGGAAAAGVALPLPTARPQALLLLLAPALVIALLLRRRHLVEALLLGNLAAVLLALALGLLPPGALLHVAPGTFGATGVLLEGMQRAVGVIVFTLLLVALVGTVQATDLLERLVAWAEGRARTPRAASAWIVAVVSGAVLLTTHSVVAILATGEFARRTGERCGVDGYRRANLLDLTVCTWPFVLPYFLPTILAASAAQGGAAHGMPVLGAWEVGRHNVYAWAVAGVVLWMIVGGRVNGARPPASTRVG
jgi:Na+/H+ antiporter NhaC